MRVHALRSMTSARLAIVDIEATVRTAAAALSRPAMGLVVVCHAGGKVAGVVSKSDLVRHLAGSGSAEATVARLMSRDVVSCGPEDDLHAIWQQMAAQSLQSLPVLDAESRPLGVLDARDALKELLEHEEYQEKLLINYVVGVGYQ